MTQISQIRRTRFELVCVAREIRRLRVFVVAVAHAIATPPACCVGARGASRDRRPAPVYPPGPHGARGWTPSNPAATGAYRAAYWRSSPDTRYHISRQSAVADAIDVRRQRGGRRPRIERGRIEALDVVEKQLGDQREIVADLFTATREALYIRPTRLHVLVGHVATSSAGHRPPIAAAHQASTAVNTPARSAR